MKNEVAMLEANEEQRAEICRALQNYNWKAIAFETFDELEKYIETSNCGIVIINLDNNTIDNKRLRKLKMKGTQLHIIALSVQPFHPELEEAFKEHISVCIGNPVEHDELVYWLKTFDP